MNKSDKNKELFIYPNWVSTLCLVGFAASVIIGSLFVGKAVQSGNVPTTIVFLFLALSSSVFYLYLFYLSIGINLFQSQPDQYSD